MFGLPLLDRELPEGIGVRTHVAAINRLVDKGAQLPQVLADGVDVLPLFTQPRLEVLQHGVGQVGEVDTRTELLEMADGGQQVLFCAITPVGLLYRLPCERGKADGRWGFLLHGVPQQGQRGLNAPLPKAKFDALEVDDVLKQHGVEFDGLRVVDDLGRVPVPMFRMEVDVGCEVDVALVELGFNLHQGGALAVELLLAVVHKAVTYLLHSFFE